MTTLFGRNLGDEFNHDIDNVVPRRKRANNMMSSSRVHIDNLCIEFEKSAFMLGDSKDGDRKRLLTYDKHMESLVDGGYGRSCTHQEFMLTLIKYYEGELDAFESSIIEDMLNDEPEFFCVAIKVLGKEAYFHEEASLLEWDKDHYRPSGTWFANMVHHGIDGLTMDDFNSLEKIERFNPMLGEYLFTRKAEQMPEGLLENHELGLFIPKEGIWPMSRQYLFRQTRKCDYSLGASRGVEEVDYIMRGVGQ